MAGPQKPRVGGAPIRSRLFHLRQGRFTPGLEDIDVAVPEAIGCLPRQETLLPGSGNTFFHQGALLHQPFGAVVEKRRLAQSKNEGGGMADCTGLRESFLAERFCLIGITKMQARMSGIEQADDAGVVREAVPDWPRRILCDQ